MTVCFRLGTKSLESQAPHPDSTNLVAQREVPSLRITVQTEERSPVPERSTTTFPVLENTKEKPKINIMIVCEDRVVRALLATRSYSYCKWCQFTLKATTVKTKRLADMVKMKTTMIVPHLCQNAFYLNK